MAQPELVGSPGGQSQPGRQERREPALVGSPGGQSQPGRQERGPAREPAELDDPPVFDRAAVDQAYRHHRARRQARLRQRREHRLARLRFLLVACGLLLVCLVIAVTIWDQAQRLFGL